jgi:AcrR family transcriptional regulator
MNARTKPDPDLRDTLSHSMPGGYGSSPKDARAVRSGIALREALLRLLERTAFEQLTVRDICAEAGIHYATFFRHHSGKEALLDDVAADQIARLVELTVPIKELGDDRGSILALCHYVEDHRLLWSVLLNGGAGATMRAEWLRATRMVTGPAPADSWLPSELGTICTTSLIVETISWWLRQERGAWLPGPIADIIHRLVTTSIASRGPAERTAPPADEPA